MMKKTLVLGASPNPSRYSYLAIERLVKHGHDVVAVGVREGEIAGIQILKGQPVLTDIDTVTLYLNPMRQEAYYDYILSLQPQRILFNPGTENTVLMRLAREAGIETIHGCTLVMLASESY